MTLKWCRLEGTDGHSAGRKLLSQLCGDPLPEIACTDRGKPYFPGNEVHFSISHTRNHAFCCVSNCNVGLDAEEQGRVVKHSVIARYYSPAEQARCRESAHFLRLWVLKEALAKLTGRGWGDWLKNTDLSPDDPRIREIDGCFVAILTEGQENHAL